MTTLEHFGTDPSFYSEAKAKAAYTNDGEEGLRIYLLKHFAKTETGYVKYQPDGQPTQFGKDQLSHHIGGPKFFLERSQGGKNQKCTQWDIVQHFEICGTEVNAFANAVFMGMRAKINFFGGYLHPLYEHRDPPTKEEMKHIQCFLDHLYVVVANRVDTTYQLLIRWFAHPCQRIKTILALLLYSKQGYGKSVFMEFFIHCVIGRNAGCAPKAEAFIGNFNGELQGKTFTLLEEPDVASKGGFKCFYNELKTTCTAKTVMINAKYKAPIECVNTNAVAMCTNRKVINCEIDDRRWVQCDISGELKDDKEHMEKMWQWNNPNEEDRAYGLKQGEIMWRYLRSIDTTQKDLRPPMTMMKAKESMPRFMEFVKEAMASDYTQEGKSITDKGDWYMTLYRTAKEQYEFWLKRKFGLKVKIPSDVSFSEDLVTCGFETKKAKDPNDPGKTKFFVCARTHKDVYAMMASRGWIAEVDEIPTEIYLEQLKRAKAAKKAGKRTAPHVKQWCDAPAKAEEKKVAKPTKKADKGIKAPEFADLKVRQDPMEVMFLASRVEHEKAVKVIKQEMEDCEAMFLGDAIEQKAQVKKAVPVKPKEEKKAALKEPAGYKERVISGEMTEADLDYTIAVRKSKGSVKTAVVPKPTKVVKLKNCEVHTYDWDELA